MAEDIAADRTYDFHVMDWRIGTIGFSYTDWAGVFYPDDLKPSDYLAFYAQNFNALELDTTFHAVPDPSRFARWAQSVDDGFRFAVKAPRAVSHDLPFDRALEPMLDFVNLARALGEKLGVILIQYPPSLSVDHKGLAGFLQYLPADVDFAVEFRNTAWHAPETIELLTEMRICLVSADYAGDSRPIQLTTDWAFLRLIGWHGRFAKHDHEQADVSDRLARWHHELLQLQSNLKRAWVFFGDDFSGFAIAPARRLIEILGLPQRHVPLLKAQTLFD